MTAHGLHRDLHRGLHHGALHRLTGGLPRQRHGWRTPRQHRGGCRAAVDRAGTAGAEFASGLRLECQTWRQDC